MIEFITTPSHCAYYMKLYEISITIFFTGKVTEHMLEKSRLVHTSQRERTFHIFYSMVAGFSESERRRYFLMDRPESYRYA